MVYFQRLLNGNLHPKKERAQIFVRQKPHLTKRAGKAKIAREKANWKTSSSCDDDDTYRMKKKNETNQTCK
jgi:hypothetical protein